MTPLPKKRHSTRRQGKRRINIRLSLPILTRCQNCHELIKPHITCPNCGQYKGQEIFALKVKTDENKKRSEASGTNSRS